MAFSTTTANPFITFPSSSVLNDIFFGAGGTACIWMNPQTFAGRNVVLGKAGSGNNDGWQMYINLTADGFGNASSASFLVSSVPNSTDRGVFSTPTSSITTNTWYHFAVTYDADDVLNVPAMYLNGVSQTVTTVDTAGGTYNSDAANVLVCMQNASSPSVGTDFNGWCEDLRLYNRILSAAEIQTIYNSRGVDNIIQGLVGRWPMIGRENIAAGLHTPNVPDVSGNNNHGVNGTFGFYIGGVIRTSAPSPCFGV